MAAAFPKLRVGEPTCYRAMTIFPLFGDGQGLVNYRLSCDALADQSVVVQEVSESGTVPELLVENKGDTTVLFLEGEQLIGAKQNRILNTSVLIAAHSTVKIPVSCVEQGRWRYRSRTFGSSDMCAPSSVRRAMKESVARAVRETGSHRSDQGKVWEEVSTLNACLSTRSETVSMFDSYVAHETTVDDYREKLAPVADAVGLAVAIGDRVVSIDLFDKPETCAKVWPRLLGGFVFDALRSTKESAAAAAEVHVQEILARAETLPWEATKPVGEGEEFRVATPAGDQGSLLAWQDTVVHASVLTKV